MVVWRSLAGNVFSFFLFFSFSFFLDLHAGYAKIKPALQLIFFFSFNPSSFICNFFIYIVVSNWVLFFYFTPGHLIFEIYFQI
jgi:hypothetical protein